MLAILPDNRAETVLLFAALLLAFAFLRLAFKKRFRPWIRGCFAGVGFVSLAIAMLLTLFPPVARIERLNYQGHDQFFWGARLHSKVPEGRQEAANALAALLKSSKSRVRVLVIQDLGECRPEEREIALEALLEFAKDEQESESLRWHAEYAIGIMFFKHVVGVLDRRMKGFHTRRRLSLTDGTPRLVPLPTKRKAKFRRTKGPAAQIGRGVPTPSIP
jgi:hypothetical protein